MIYSNTETFSILSKGEQEVKYHIDILENYIFKIIDSNGLRLSLYDGEKNLSSGILKEFQKIKFSIYMESDNYFLRVTVNNIQQEPIELNKNLDTVVIPIYLNLYLQRTEISYITKAVIKFSSRIRNIFSIFDIDHSFTITFSESKIRSDNCFICLIRPYYMTFPFYIEDNKNILISKSDQTHENLEGYILFDIIRCI